MSTNCHGLAKSTCQYHSNYRVFLFAFRLLKIESNHEHVLSWARKIHMTVPFLPRRNPSAPLGAMTNLLGSTSNQVAFVQSIL